MDIKETRRGYPRVTANVPAELRMPNGKILRTQVLNVSCSGLQLECDGETASRITPSPAAEGGAELAVRLHLPMPGQPVAGIQARCRVIYARPLAAGDYVVGLSCLRFEGDGYEHLERFSDQSLDSFSDERLWLEAGARSPEEPVH